MGDGPGRVLGAREGIDLAAGDATFRVSCKSFRVEDRGQVLEEETPMSVRQNEKFKKLLEEVAARLKNGVEEPKHEP